MPSATPACPRLPTRFHLDKAEVVGSSPTSPISAFAGICCTGDLRLYGCDRWFVVTLSQPRRRRGPPDWLLETSAYWVATGENYLARGAQAGRRTEAVERVGQRSYSVRFAFYPVEVAVWEFA